MDERLQTNRAHWNECTPIHAASDFYDVAGFKAGRITLKDLERREVGDVSGKTLLHVQCHFGLDTMSWSRLGARATGVDFSDAAIDLARSLNDELGLDARFICANVYDLPKVLHEQFDVVFASYGVLIWLPDLAEWARVVSNHLKPGGVFYVVEFHPLFGLFEPQESGDWRPRYRYFHGQLYFDDVEPSYAGGPPSRLPCTSGSTPWATSSPRSSTRASALSTCTSSRTATTRPSPSWSRATTAGGASPPTTSPSRRCSPSAPASEGRKGAYPELVEGRTRLSLGRGRRDSVG